MSIQVRSRISRDGQKIWYSFEWGKGPGERQATGMFTYSEPNNEIQENYNKDSRCQIKNQPRQKNEGIYGN